MRLLISLFSSSKFITDLFLKRPELLDSLIRVDLTRIRKTRDEMLKELLTSIQETGDLEEKLDRMRRYRVEEFVRIGLHDLGGELDLDESAAQLSNLAEACIEGALSLSVQELESNYGSFPQGRFAVLGMGALGGKEIDYHSDLDLFYIYDTPKQRSEDSGGPLDAHQYYVRLGKRLITFLSAPTKEGQVYNLDLRRRPSGRSGPLVSSLEAFRGYHETSSELWEQQALIKARFVAGDRSLGRDVESVTEQYAYGKALTEDGIERIHQLRMRMERELAGEDPARFNVKTGRGAMIDIEFVTQMLQLAHGHKHTGLRMMGTLEALRALWDHRILTEEDYRLLSDGYRFLRQLDHRLQLKRDQSIYTLERDPDKLQGIAHAIGYRDHHKTRAGEGLLRDYEQRREQIRACYDRFFKTEDMDKNS
jgi:glutamate-ammonia-ligase adenylyltransferase